MEKVTKNRINVYMNPDSYKWVSEQASKMGISLTGYINVLVAQERKQSDVLSMTEMLKSFQEQAKEGK